MLQKKPHEEYFSGTGGVTYRPEETFCPPPVDPNAPTGRYVSVCEYVLYNAGMVRSLDEWGNVILVPWLISAWVCHMKWAPY